VKLIANLSFIVKKLKLKAIDAIKKCQTPIYMIFADGSKAVYLAICLQSHKFSRATNTCQSLEIPHVLELPKNFWYIADMCNAFLS